ncbi:MULTISPECIES: MAPEG family protein [unclassified Pseudoalteromonas]|uniref:MAPEG family protein n=1 Tax=unclassified Pseudoalteromonas TaxID=194690 RepID=UPI0025B5E7DD|nr:MULTISPECIES: MAPEG family protein [unclassified Pseudoalteromonas]MDN3377563.1 MAPEG family protein [Pseudoalteromonas sp. APC 3893]MDN3385270.1 MAPEG family protein [Pseudoalteromonas sp. APC 4017]
MTELALSAYFALYFYLIMVFTQWAVATFSKASQKDAVPGKIDSNLSHDSFVFRAHRTFKNTLENSVLFLGTVFFSFIIGYHSAVFAICMWVYVIARCIHMALYYVIATEKNPSPRSYFFLAGVGANMVMLVLLGLRLIAF